MLYESVIAQLKETPAHYLTEISHYIEFLNQKSGVENKISAPASKDLFFALAGNVHLDASSVETFREESRL